MPTVERFALEKPPLVYVLGLVKFSAVDIIGKSVPEIQESFRKLGYPRLSEGNIQSTHMSPAGVQTTMIPRWEFHNRNRSAGIALTKDVVALQFGRYESFDKFCSTFESVIGILYETVRPDLIEQIGLRYVDVIVDEPVGKIQAFVQPGLLGIPEAQLAMPNSSSFMNQSWKEGRNMLSVRAHARTGGGFMPPDLMGTSIAVSAEGVLEGRKLIVLDFDNSSDLQLEPLDFTRQAVSGPLWELHDQISSAFLAATTSVAWEAWGKRERTQ